MKTQELETLCPECYRPIKKQTGYCLECGDFVDHVLTAVPRPGPCPTDYLKTAIILAAIVLVGIFVFTAYEAIRGANIVDGGEAIKKAETYLSRGEHENAINLLSRSVEEDKSGKHKKAVQALLDQSLFEQGGKLAQSGHYRDAVTAYSRIAPTYKDYDQVSKLIADYSDKALPVEFSQVMRQPMGAAPVDLSKFDKAVMTVVPPTKAKN